MSRKVVLAALLAVIVLAAPIAALQEDLTATRNLLGDKPNKVKNTAGAGGGAASGGQAVAGGSGTSISGSTNTGGDGIYISDGRRLLNEKPKKVKVTNTAGAGGGAASGGQAVAGGEENVVSGSYNTGGDGIYDGRRLLNEKPKKVKVTNTAGAGGGAASGGQAVAGGEENVVSGSDNTGGDGIYNGRRLL